MTSSYTKLERRIAIEEALTAFDGIWTTCLSEYPAPGKMSPKRLRAMARGRTYAWLAHQLGMPKEECKITKFDPEICSRVVAICSGVTYSDIRTYFRERRLAEVNR